MNGKKSDKPPAPLQEEIDRRKKKEEMETRNIVSVADVVGGTLDHFKAVEERMRAKDKERRDTWFPIFSASPKKIACSEHEHEYRLSDFELSLQLATAELFTTRYQPCPLCKREALVNEKFGKFLKMGVPLKIGHASLENYEHDIEPKKLVVKQASQILTRGSGFFIAVGKSGTGKSHICAAMLKWMGEGLFITHTDLADELRATYDDGGKTRMLAKYKKTKCLVLDEIDESVKGDDVKTMIYSILAYRYDRDLVTCLTSNHDLLTLLAILGKRIEDRMAQNYVCATFTWESYRRQHRVI